MGRTNTIVFTKMLLVVSQLFLAMLLTSCLAEEVVENSSKSIDFIGAETAIPLSSSSIRVSWSLASSSQVTGYRIFSMNSELELSPIGVASSVTSGYTIENLEAETKYYYVVRALTNSQDYSDENVKFVSATTLEPEPLSISPETKSIAVSSILQLKAIGGSPPYSFSILSGTGIIDAATGEFVAPSTAGLVTVRLTDSASAVAIANLTIVNKVKIYPSYRQLQVDRQMFLTAKDGTPPYSFELISGKTLASLDTSTNKLIPLGGTGLVSVRVTDANGIIDDATISLVSEYYPKVSMGVGTTMCIAKVGLSGSAKCWGNNVAGKLGHANSPGSVPGSMGDNLPEVNFGSETVLDIAITNTNNGSPCALLSNGKVKCWGASWSRAVIFSGTTGQGSYVGDALGDINSASYIHFGTGRSAVAIGALETSACVLLDNNQMKCWGDAYEGRLLNGSTTNHYSASTSLGDSLPYLDFGTGRSVKSFSSGNRHSCAILDNDRLKCWGQASWGKLGNGTGSGNLGDSVSEVGDSLPYVDLGTGRTVKQVSAGYNHTCAVLDNDLAKCWGYGGDGRLGLGSTVSYGDNPGEMGDSLPYVNLGTGRTVKWIEAGPTFTCAILDNDRLKCWGANNYGQIGLQVNTDIGDSPAEMGDNLAYVDLGTGLSVTKIGRTKSHSTCVVLSDLSTKCFGANANGELGLGHRDNIGHQAGQMGDNLSSIDLGTGRTVKKITNANTTTCAILDNDRLKCWGPTVYGNTAAESLNSIGDEPSEKESDLPDTVISSTSTIKKVLTGEFNTCVLLTNGQLKCWGRQGYSVLAGTGNNIYGDLGNSMGDLLPALNLSSTNLVEDFDMWDGDNICARFDNAQMKCWGRGDLGQLGSESTASMGADYKMGDDIPFVNLGSGRSVKKMAKGVNHVCAILDNDKVKCWGNNVYGQLGIGSTVRMGDDVGEMGDNLPYVDLGTGVVPIEITAGVEFTCILTADYRVKCWGRNTSGMLGRGDLDTIGDQAGEMGDNLPFVDFGSSEKILQIQAGSYHSCVLFESERVKCWGSGSGGKTAMGKSAVVGDQAGEMGSNLPFIDLGEHQVKEMFVKSDNSCFQLEDDRITCFGIGHSGQLRQGDLNHFGDNPNEQGANILYVKQD